MNCGTDRTGYVFDAAGREATVNVSAYDTSTGQCNAFTATTTKSYDAANRLLGVVTQYNPTSEAPNPNDAPTFGWGPNGHPVTFRSTVYGDGSVHWDGNTPLFVTTSAGSLSEIFLGTSGVITPATTGLGSELTVIDRSWSGALAIEHNGTGFSSWNPFPSGFSAGDAPGKFGGAPVKYSPRPSSAGYDQAPYLPVSEMRTDGVTIAGQVFQGPRTYDPAIGGWTTPDPFKGRIGDPQSQKSYIWNRNNPVQYSDPSGFCIEDGCIGEAIAAGVAIDAIVTEDGPSIEAEVQALSEQFAQMMGEDASGVLSKIKSPKLARIFKDLFKERDTIPGGTAGAMKHTLDTGELVSGKDHIEKAAGYAQGLKNWLKEEPNASIDEKNIAKALLKNLLEQIRRTGRTVKQILKAQNNAKT